jgi:hypothetical protein
VALGGRIWRDPNAVVTGSVTQFGAAAFVGLTTIPLLPVILIVALVVWLVNRNRRPAQVRA